MVHTQPIKRPNVGFNKRAKEQPKAPLVWHTGLSGVPPDSVRCTTGQCPVHQRNPTPTRHLRENPEPARYNSPDCPVYTGQCPVLQRDAVLELASLGISRRLLRYNSPDMSGVHRTVRCTSGATTISVPTATCDAFNARAARAEGRGAHTGAPDNEQEMSGVHRTSRRA
jgi:hypothetical protein